MEVNPKKQIHFEKKEEKKPSSTKTMSLERLAKICDIFTYLGSLKKGDKIAIDKNLNVSFSGTDAKKYTAFNITNSLTAGLAGWATQAISRKMGGQGIAKTTHFFSEDLPKILEEESEGIDQVLQSLTKENAKSILGPLRSQLILLARETTTISKGLVQLKTTYAKKTPQEKEGLQSASKKLLEAAAKFCAENLIKIDENLEKFKVDTKIEELPAEIKPDEVIQEFENLSAANVGPEQTLEIQNLASSSEKIKEEKSTEAVNDIAQYFPEVQQSVETAPIKTPSLTSRQEQLKYLIRIAETIIKKGVKNIDAEIENKKIEIKNATQSKAENIDQLKKELEKLEIYREAAQFAQHKTLRVKEGSHPYAFKFVARLQDHMNYIFRIEQTK